MRCLFAERMGRQQSWGSVRSAFSALIKDQYMATSVFKSNLGTTIAAVSDCQFIT
ncbi:hypothetical protein HNQ36_005198 [Afipia massiliensis]|uniref:Uncharacterized protein n=1 Tax=Afipia massiliensis TaxID=211460 RepID=A0A840N9A9_9BRAD|nr:hypothetical protein [Afipia massiliensis]